MIKVSTTGMAVSLKTDLRFPISGQWGHGDRIIQMIATFLVFIYHDWTPGIKLSGTVHPHITLAVMVVAVCYHLRWCFSHCRTVTFAGRS